MTESVRRAIGVGVCLLVLGAVPTPASAQQTKDELERQKLEMEIKKLEQETGLRGFLSGNAAALTALVGIVGLLLTLRSQNREHARQRELDREQRRADRRQRRAEERQRAAETERLLDERFAAILSDLGSDKQGLQASAAVSLLAFVPEERSAFHKRLRLTCLATLKVPQAEPVRKLLVGVLEQALRTAAPIAALESELSGAALARVDLSHLDLSAAQLHGADLTSAELVEATLRDAEGREVVLERAFARGVVLMNARLPRARAARARFHGARLVNAHLHEADLRGCNFKGAELQAAHFERADLRGARFDGANVADTYFVDAQLDDVALQSLRRAENLDRAHFSDGVLESSGGHNEGRVPNEGPPLETLPPSDAPG